VLNFIAMELYKVFKIMRVSIFLPHIVDTLIDVSGLAVCVDVIKLCSNCCFYSCSLIFTKLATHDL